MVFRPAEIQKTGFLWAPSDIKFKYYVLQNI
jgi:hypothetical protein